MRRCMEDNHSNLDEHLLAERLELVDIPEFMVRLIHFLCNRSDEGIPPDWENPRESCRWVSSDRAVTEQSTHLICTQIHTSKMREI